ncbi:MAG TPA: hypothetical protein VMU36_06765 [Spirochaetia bacterium]|nr:hypothetical protein [Spirochaetia bacterium]
MRTLGPVGLGNNDLTSASFIPTKPAVASLGAFNVQTGFIVTSYSGNEQLLFAYTDQSGNLQTTFVQGFPLNGADPNYPLYEYDATTSTTTAANIIVFFFNPTNPAASNANLYTATLPSGPVSAPIGVTLSSIFSPNNVLGASIFPNSGTPDTFNFLLAGVSTYSSGSASVNTAPPPPFGAGTSTTGPALTIPGSRSFYYSSGTPGMSYASFSSGGSWICEQWPTGSTTATVMPGVTHRIDALLTTGDLLSTEGGVLRLYDPNGSLVLSVSLGGLQYCYEAYVGPTPYVFFSLPISLSHGDWDFRVYAIPTSSMRGLGG